MYDLVRQQSPAETLLIHGEWMPVFRTINHDSAVSLDCLISHGSNDVYTSTCILVDRKLYMQVSVGAAPW